MRVRSLSGLCLASLCLSAVLAPGCGSSDNKKKAPRYMSGGEGGADIGEAGSGGSLNSGATAGSSGDAGFGPGGGDAGSGNGVGGDVGGPVGGASTDGEGGAGGEGPTKPFHGLYVGESGDDTADGTVDAPFLTLTHAASVAQAGDTIVFLDGSYSPGTLAVIPDGVDLMAQNPGGVTLNGNGGTMMNLTGDTRIEGLKFQNAGRVAYYGAGTEATGTLTIVDSSFIGCSNMCFDLTGSVAVEISANEGFVIGNGTNIFAHLNQDSRLSVVGGVFQNYGAGGVIIARGDSTVELSTLEVLNGGGPALALSENAIGSLDGVTVATLGSVMLEVRQESELTIKNSDISIKPLAQTKYYCISVLDTYGGVGVVTIEDSTLHDCGTAIAGSMLETLTLTNVDIGNMTGGIELGYSGGQVGGTFRITDSDFHDLNYSMRFGSNSQLHDIKVRGTTFSAAADATWNNVIFYSSNASTLDFGTLAEPGGNTFVNAANSAMQVLAQAAYVSAVGNTWNPNQQNADNQGKYSAPAGQKLEVNAATGAGRNFTVPYNSIMLLAESP